MPQNLSNDTTLAYLLNKQKSSSEKYADAAAEDAASEAAQGVVDSLQPQITANATAIVKSCQDVLDVTLPNVSSSKRTFTVPWITADHELIQNGFALLSNPNAARGELVLTTTANTITVTGDLSGTTTIYATFCIKDQDVNGS